MPPLEPDEQDRGADCMDCGFETSGADVTQCSDCRARDDHADRMHDARDDRGE